MYFRYNYYSVPFYYAGEDLLLKVDEKSFQVFKNELLITTHVIHPGTKKFITMDCHKPCHKQAKTDLHYKEEMQTIGVHSVRVYELLRVTKPYHWKNMIKGILRLKEVHKNCVIEAACLQAMEDGAHDYKNIRDICIKQSNLKKVAQPFSIPKGTNGYYRDLSIYERLVNRSI